MENKVAKHALLPGGTRVFWLPATASTAPNFSDTPDAGTLPPDTTTDWVEVPEFKSIGELGDVVTNWADASVLADTRAQSVPGQQESEDLEFGFVDVTDETDGANYEKLVMAAKAKEVGSIGVMLPNGRVCYYGVQLGGFKVAELSLTEVISSMIPAKKRTDTMWKPKASS
ncbi:phage tail tube protein [Paraferrimonas haliotis]|uniref:Phage tail protein n=1 Tax=Paraferrimonas haliotis TaxID=2013866 RepID=A0AA37TRR1_9GAMM|nr:phage tail tube protein [Paraferrimonas haliotis]GLS83221.1 hypothetical protein GCM10007894_11980 [Paraferrimonas haliotis]